MNLEEHAVVFQNQEPDTALPSLPAIRNSQLAAAEFILIAMADAITPMMQQVPAAARGRAGGRVAALSAR